jgi:DNA adenine methylase
MKVITSGQTPHIVQYQGSKRLLAPRILQYMPTRFNKLFEPFAGMAAITIAAAKERRADSYHINDINEPIINLLQSAVNEPDELAERYSQLWNEQFDHPGGHLEHFYHVRSCFNYGKQSAERMLYLLARCVKGSVRYGKNGNFNQSPDKRRHGTNPAKIADNVRAISGLLIGKATFTAMDYREVFAMARIGDLIYMDPPYQGVSNAKDHRYFAGVDFDQFVESIESLNKRGIDFIISYDGECGEKGYGNELPQDLLCKKILLIAGLSTQSTLLGKRDTTFEALYISKNLIKRIDRMPTQMTLEMVG